MLLTGLHKNPVRRSMRHAPSHPLLNYLGSRKVSERCFSWVWGVLIPGLFLVLLKGIFYFWALLRYLLGIIFNFLGVLKQILVFKMDDRPVWPF